MTGQRMPLSAVGMIAAHLYLDAKKESGMDDRQLGYFIPGCQGTTYGDRLIYTAACDAHKLAKAVEETSRDWFDKAREVPADPKE